MIDVASPLIIGDLIELFTTPDELFGVFIDGLAKSAVYVMIASGLTLIFGLMDVINFAHGSFTMLGAYLAAGLLLVAGASQFGLLVAIVILLGVMILTFVGLAIVGTVFEIGLISKLYEYPPIFQILLTFGLTLVLEEFMRMLVQASGINNGVYQNNWQEAAARPSGLRDSFEVLFVNINPLQALQILMGVVTVVAIWGFLNRTRYGLFVRAGVQDEEMAQALGINVKQTFTVVFAVGSGIAGLAGAMLVWDPVWDVSVPLALSVLLPAFVIVIVGGLGSYKGTVVASLIVGMIDGLTTWMFVTGVVRFAGLQELMIFAILVGMLILKPQGLYGIEVDHG
ncbi:MAG: branched-chain amino acid ABC transporter permease [Halovenus sp.]